MGKSTSRPHTRWLLIRSFVRGEPWLWPHSSQSHCKHFQLIIVLVDGRIFVFLMWCHCLFTHLPVILHCLPILILFDVTIHFWPFTIFFRLGLGIHFFSNGYSSFERFFITYNKPRVKYFDIFGYNSQNTTLKSPFHYFVVRRTPKHLLSRSNSYFM